MPGLTGLSVLARGGYATVYRAMQESVGRLVAVKVENRILESERDQRRFMREARAAGRMSSHPHVVDLFDAGDAAAAVVLLGDWCPPGKTRAAALLLTTRDPDTPEPVSVRDARPFGLDHADRLATPCRT